MTSASGRRSPRTPFAADDGGSLPMAMLLILVGASLSAVLMPVVAGQMTASRVAEQRSRSLHAALAGVDAATALIRAAVDSDGGGALERLPACELTGGLGTGSTARRHRYTVTVTYRNGAGDRLPGCPPTSVPVTATLLSTGTFGPGGSGTRTIEAVYTFRATNQNIPGGLLRLAPQNSSSPPSCLAADSADPAAGSVLRVELCAPDSDRQKFAYDPELRLRLVSSAQHTSGMCLDAEGPGARVTFRACAAPAQLRQQWAFTGAAMFEAVNGDRVCFTAADYSPGSLVTLDTCDGVGIWQNQVVNPEAATGAGAAGPASGQLVNYRQFGRCLDVTRLDVTYEHLILWPCKQALDPRQIDWNQRWALPGPATGARHASGLITIRPDGQPRHCLRSPRSATAGRYVDIVPCPMGSTSPELNWTVYGNTGNYETSYRIVDAAGLCLSPTDPEAVPPDLYRLHGHRISKSVMRPCDASTLQKWNADPYVLDSEPLQYFGER